MSLVRNRDWADDLVQETFIRAWSHLPTAGWLPSATWRRDRVLFYDGTLWLEEGSTELTTDRFTYLDGVATLLVEGELTIHEAVPPEVLAEKLAKVHNFGTIRGTPPQMGALRARMDRNKGTLGRQRGSRGRGRDIARNRQHRLPGFVDAAGNGRRYGLLSGTWIVFQDAPLAAGIRAVVTLAAGAATGPLLVLATERFVSTALDVAGGELAMAAITVPVITLAALFAVEILETVVRSLADSRIEAGLRRGFRADLTEKRARLEYHYIENQETWDLLRRVVAGPQMESRPAPERGPVKQAFDDGIGLAAIAVRVVGIAAVLARLGWWIVPLAIAIMVLYVLLGIRGGRRLYEFERRAATRRRRAEYLSDEVLQAREAASERGLFGYASYLTARWRAVYVGVVRANVLVNLRNWIRYKGAEAPRSASCWRPAGTARWSVPTGPANPPSPS